MQNQITHRLCGTSIRPILWKPLFATTDSLTNSASRKELLEGMKLYFEQNSEYNYKIDDNENLLITVNNIEIGLISIHMNNILCTIYQYKPTGEDIFLGAQEVKQYEYSNPQFHPELILKLFQQTIINRREAGDDL